MTAPDRPPFALDGTVTRDKLVELLSVQTELAWLDFKEQCDLSVKAELVELVKDVGAMSILGGYLVVGVDDSGTAVGLPAGQERPFDEAALSAKLAGYLPPSFVVRSAVHDLDSGAGPRRVALVWVGPHPAGLCVFTRNGDHNDNAGRQQKPAFRAGEVYARHGTASEPWSQGDIAAVLAALVSRAKDAWRAEHAEETRLALQAALSGASVAAGPSDAFSWQLDATGFEAAAVELLRRDDDVPVRRMLRAAVRDAQRLVDAGGDSAEADLAVALNRPATLAALGLELRRPAFTTMAVEALLVLYDLGVSSQYSQLPGPRMGLPQLWLRIAERLYALGALAVRLQAWATVRYLALAPVSALDQQQGHRPWHRHALTEASRSGHLQVSIDGQHRVLSLLMFARATAAADPALHPDLPQVLAAEHGRPDPLLTSLCQFDLLVNVVAGVAAAAQTERDLFAVSYPNFARIDEGRADVITRPLIAAGPMRTDLLPGVADQQLARVLNLADHNAEQESRGFWGWAGYADPVVQAFISTHLPRA